MEHVLSTVGRPGWVLWVHASSCGEVLSVSGATLLWCAFKWMGNGSPVVQCPSWGLWVRILRSAFCTHRHCIKLGGTRYNRKHRAALCIQLNSSVVMVAGSVSEDQGLSLGSKNYAFGGVDHPQPSSSPCRSITPGWIGQLESWLPAWESLTLTFC